MVEHRRLQIVNAKGLHARASARLVEVVEKFEADAELSHGGVTAGGDSIMGLLMLAAPRGSVVDLRTEGNDEAVLADAIVALVSDRFGEGE